jgi:predicted nucleotidyltransferase component of viral defense system
MSLYPQILNEKQKDLIKDIGFLNFPPYYLSGGTALALQLGHRTSLDFDFDSNEKFDSQQLFVDAETVSRTENTLQVVINEISVSIFYYPYKLIDNLVNFESIQLAGLCDIAAMKVVAIIQRARQRDFVDIYYLIKSLGLRKVIDSVYQKYPWYLDNEMIIFKSLIYFEEADNDSEAGRITIFDSKTTWEKVKLEIKIEVDKYLAEIHE